MSNSAAAPWSEPRASIASSNLARPSPSLRRFPNTIHTRSFGSTADMLHGGLRAPPKPPASASSAEPPPRSSAEGLGLRTSDNPHMGPSMSLTVRRRLGAIARGERAADLYLRGASVLNVFTGEILAANVAIAGERIAYVGARDDMVRARTRVMNVTGRVLVPGYID